MYYIPSFKVFILEISKVPKSINRTNRHVTMSISGYETKTLWKNDYRQEIILFQVGCVIQKVESKYKFIIYQWSTVNSIQKLPPTSSWFIPTQCYLYNVSKLSTSARALSAFVASTCWSIYSNLSRLFAQIYHVDGVQGVVIRRILNVCVRFMERFLEDSSRSGGFAYASEKRGWARGTEIKSEVGQEPFNRWL